MQNSKFKMEKQKIKIKNQNILIIFLFLFLINNCWSRIFLHITKNFNEKAEIVILLPYEETPYWKTFLFTLKQDLEYSGYFLVPTAKFVNDISSEKKNFSVELVLSSEKVGENIKFIIEDLLDNEKLFEKEFSIHTNPKVFAHIVNDEIIFSLTGKPGIATSKIAFVSDKTGSYQIYMIDYDGENEIQITDEKFHIDYPTWLEVYKSLILVSYQKGWPQLVKFDIYKKSITTLLGEPGLNACADVCKKTKEIAVVLSKSGDPEIYITDFNGKNIKRITYYKGVDSSPSFSPNGDMIAFVSDRQGSPQIYIMNRDGFKIKRISYGSPYATSPSWSPDGELIAYVSRKSGNFELLIYEIKTQKTIMLGDTFGNEEISWAPDSRHIVYSKVNKKPYSLWIVDIYTKEQRRLTSPGYNCFSPAWAN